MVLELCGGPKLLQLAILIVIVAGNVAGDWITSHLHSAQRCTVDRVPIDALTKAEFVQFYEEKYPVILQGTSQTRLAHLTEKVRISEQISRTNLGLVHPGCCT